MKFNPLRWIYSFSDGIEKSYDYVTETGSKKYFKLKEIISGLDIWGSIQRFWFSLEYVFSYALSQISNFFNALSQILNWIVETIQEVIDNMKGLR